MCVQRKKTGRKNVKISAVVELQAVLVLFFKLFIIIQILMLCMPSQRKIINTKQNANRSYL